MKGLTGRQQSILDYIREYASERGYPPTLREIGERFDISWPAARNHLKALARKGMIMLSEGRSRGIELPGGIPSAAASSLPLVGEVRAGEPILAVENIEEHIALDKNLFKDEGSFVLRVKGDSMRDAGILEGDYVVVSPSREVRTGQMGVALVEEEEATVKEIRYEGGDVVLVPHNPDYETTRHRAGTVRILGRVTGVVRKL